MQREQCDVVGRVNCSLTGFSTSPWSPSVHKEVPRWQCRVGTRGPSRQGVRIPPGSATRSFGQMVCAGFPALERAPRCRDGGDAALCNAPQGLVSPPLPQRPSRHLNRRYCPAHPPPKSLMAPRQRHSQEQGENFSFLLLWGSHPQSLQHHEHSAGEEAGFLRTSRLLGLSNSL